MWIMTKDGWRKLVARSAVEAPVRETGRYEPWTYSEEEATQRTNAHARDWLTSSKARGSTRDYGPVETFTWDTQEVRTKGRY